MTETRMDRMGTDEQCCVTVMRDCSDPDGPIVSSDCGIYDPVVRAWASGSAGVGAPWGSAPAQVVLDCGPCERYDDACRECIEQQA